jgi:hypothetical protein
MFAGRQILPAVLAVGNRTRPRRPEEEGGRMTFSVRPDAIDTFGDSVNNLAGDAEKAKKYVDSALQDIDKSRGILFGLMYSVAVMRIGDAVKADLQKLQQVSSASGAELKKCARVYRATEKKNAERMDAAYPKK